MKGISRGAARLKAVAVFALLAWTGALLASCGGASPAASVDYNVIATAALQNLTVGTEIPAAAAELAKVTISLANVEAKSDFPEAGDLDAVSWIKYKSVDSDAGEESFTADPTTHASAIGLKATAKASASEAGKAKDTITMTFSGTFSAAFEGTLTAIVIPAARLSSGKDLRVELKSGDAAESGIKVKIVNAGAPISENAADIYAFDAATADADGFVVEYVLSAKFSAAVAAGATDVFETTGLPTGVTASVAEAVAADANRIKIKFAAGATAAASESVSDVRIKFKKEKLSGADADIEIAEPVKIFIRKAAAQRKAVIGGGAVSGETRKAIEPKTLTITLDGDVIASGLNAVVDSSKPETDASRYFDITGLIDGLEATGLKARLAADVAKGAKSFNIVVYGTPAWNAAGYAGDITGTIPASIEDGDDEIKVLTGTAGISVAKADSDTTTAFSIVMKPYAEIVADEDNPRSIIAIAGKADNALGQIMIDIHGVNGFDGIAEQNVITWFGTAGTDYPAGMTATVASIGQNAARATITIGYDGTGTSTFSAKQFKIVIPGGKLLGQNQPDVAVDSNEFATIEVRNPYATVAATEDSPNSFVAIVGNQVNELGCLDITLHGATLKELTVNTSLLGWFGTAGVDYPAGMTATLANEWNDGADVSISIGYDGTGTATFAEKPFKIVIPATDLAGENPVAVAVDSNAFATIAARAPYISIDKVGGQDVRIIGGVGTDFADLNQVFTIHLHGLTFNNTLSAEENSETNAYGWIKNANKPTAYAENTAENGLKLLCIAVSNERDRATFKFFGTPDKQLAEKLIVEIPKEVITGNMDGHAAADFPLNENDVHAVFLIREASLDDVEMVGVVGQSWNGTTDSATEAYYDVKVTLVNDTFDGENQIAVNTTDCRSWFVHLDNDLFGENTVDVKAVALNAAKNELTIRVTSSGEDLTDEVGEDIGIVIAIPAGCLKSGVELSTKVNNNATLSITNPSNN